MTRSIEELKSELADSQEWLKRKLELDEFNFRSWAYGQYILRESIKQREDPNYDSPLNYE